jgi:hypothetical protein
MVAAETRGTDRSGLVSASGFHGGFIVRAKSSPFRQEWCQARG